MAAKNLQFKIEQVAICPPNKEAALRFMAALGIDPGAWVFDHVLAKFLAKTAPTRPT
jgi:hypothetical protein